MNIEAVSLRSDDPGAGTLLHETVSAALVQRRSAPVVAIDLDGTHLSPAFVAVLVRELRRVRETGGSILIDVRNQALRDAIRLHGLDRIFGTATALRRPQIAVHPAAIPATLGRPATA